MFARLVSLLQLRRSTAFLLEREDDHLLRDIGLTRADIEAMHMGQNLDADRQGILRLRSFSFRRGLPVAA